jgi:hypothetical protein
MFIALRVNIMISSVGATCFQTMICLDPKVHFATTELHHAPTELGKYLVRAGL